MGALLSVEGVRHPIIRRDKARAGSLPEQSVRSALTMFVEPWPAAPDGVREVDFVTMVILNMVVET